MRANKKNKIYKYTSIECAIEILKNNSVKLEYPNNYNDPFDSNIYLKEKDKNRAIEIITEYYTAQELLKLFDDSTIKKKKSAKFITKLDKFLLNLYLNASKKNKYYDSIPVIRGLSKLMIKLGRSSNQAKFKREFENLSNELYNKIISLRDKALVSCFGKRYDSILMWAHYGNKHSGVCIEYNRPIDNFLDVKYSKKCKPFKIEWLTRKYLGCLLAKEEIDVNNRFVINTVMQPFITKAAEWSYEEEVRCIFNDNSSAIYRTDKYYLYRMPSLPIRIYIGCKAVNNEKLSELIEIANKNKIEVVKMKISKSKFTVVPNK